MDTGIAVVNCGSTSLKFAIYASGNNQLRLLYRGMIEGMRTAPRLVVKDNDAKPIATHEWGKGRAIRPRPSAHICDQLGREKFTDGEANSRGSSGRARRRALSRSRADRQ
jgi:acetate kinase